MNVLHGLLNLLSVREKLNIELKNLKGKVIVCKHDGSTLESNYDVLERVGNRSIYGVKPCLKSLNIKKLFIIMFLLDLLGVLNEM